MNRRPLDHETSLDNDAVWKLLDLAPPASAGPRFIDDTVRAARLIGQQESWWRRFFAPAPLAGLAGAAALVALGLFTLPGTLDTADGFHPLANSVQAAEIQEIAETEALIAAADHLDEFSDTELVSLIGF